jgi:mono/diheme cytochrome c family protein
VDARLRGHDGDLHIAIGAEFAQMLTKRMATALAAFACAAVSVAPAQAQGTAPPASPSQPEASPNDIDGETLFATVCGFCHEQGGRSTGKAPKLAGTTRSDEFIINRIKTGKPGAMPAFGRVFSEGQIYAILAYIRGLEG